VNKRQTFLALLFSAITGLLSIWPIHVSDNQYGAFIRNGLFSVGGQTMILWTFLITLSVLTLWVSYDNKKEGVD